MKTALITGAATRIGRAMALYLASRGWDVAIHYNSSATAAESLAAEIQSHGQRVELFAADLLDEAAIADLVPQVQDRFACPISVLINNASIFEYDNFATADRASWDRHMMSNLRAPFVLTQAFAKQVPTAIPDENGEPVAQGLVINMVDQRVQKLTPEFTTYTLAKAALWTLTQTSAQGLAPHVRVNAIGPGPTLQGHRQTSEHFMAQRAATILERGSSPQEICAALGYFIDAIGVTGQLICVDGGQHLGWQTPDILGPE